MKSTRALVLFASFASFASFACGGAPSTRSAPSGATSAAPAAPSGLAPLASASSSASSGSPEMARTPYTAEEIRRATTPGRTYEYLVEAAGKGAIHRVMTFTRATDTEPETRMVEVDANGIEAAPKTFTATWEELRHHGEFPRSSVVIDDRRITVPAGTFDCARYTLTKGAGSDAEVTQFYFAKSLPGPPVLFFTDKAGTRVTSSTLVRYLPGH